MEDNLERLVKVETYVENIKEDLTEIKLLLTTQLAENKQTDELNSKKYAGKWVEYVVKTAVVAMIGALLAMIKLGGL